MSHWTDAMLVPQPSIKDHADLSPESGPWRAEPDHVRLPAMVEAAPAEITQWPGSAPTPLHALSALAASLNLRSVYYKHDEGARLWQAFGAHRPRMVVRWPDRAAGLQAAMALGPDSRVLLLGCEGATDPEIYRAMVGQR